MTGVDKEEGSASVRDNACAVLARAALFPVSIDYAGNHHLIRPALQALDVLRKQVLGAENIPVSKLFPRHVIVVPSASGGMQWNGQPDIHRNTASFEVIPEKLSVKCMPCGDKNDGKEAFIQSLEHKEANRIHEEIVLCTDRLLKSDYLKSSDPTLLEQRKDLPPRSLAAVEESLAHEIRKIHISRKLVDKQRVNGDDTSASWSECDRYAHIELQAARMAQCLFRREGSEIYRGSALRPQSGFSMLPESLQTDLQHRCARKVATEATTEIFGKERAEECISRVSK